MSNLNIKNIHGGTLDALGEGFPATAPRRRPFQRLDPQAEATAEFVDGLNVLDARNRTRRVMILQALADAGITDQTIPTSQSLPNYSWLAPKTIAAAIGASPLMPGLSASTTVMLK